jgi:hypothetical protein
MQDVRKTPVPAPHIKCLGNEDGRSEGSQIQERLCIRAMNTVIKWLAEFVYYGVQMKQ